MKTRIFNLRLAVVSSLIVCMSLAGCDYFRNPLDDKETGETVKLLVVDFNFIKTKIAFHLKDMDSNEYIDNEEIELFFLGEDAGNVITFTGTKPDHFTTEAGFLEIGIDPNVVGSAANPINLSVVAVSEHHISAPIALSYTTEGIKDVLIKMISIGSMK